MTVRTIGKLSKVLDCSRSTVKNFIAQGMPSRVVKEDDWLNGKREFDLEEVANWLSSRKDGTKMSNRFFAQKASVIKRKIKEENEK